MTEARAGRPRKYEFAGRKPPKAAKGPTAALSLAQMTRRLCARCGDREALFAGTRCCSCGADAASKTKVRRTRFNALMQAKP
jgi:hypothetical protein